MESKKIQNLSEQIAELESEMCLDKNMENNQKKIEDIMSTLSFEEMLQIDNYIIRNKLLKK